MIVPAGQVAEPVIVPVDLVAEKVSAPVALVAEIDLVGQGVKMETGPVVQAVVEIVQVALVVKMMIVPADRGAEVIARAVQEVRMVIDPADQVVLGKVTVPEDLVAEIARAVPGMGIDLGDPVAEIGLADLGVATDLEDPVMEIVQVVPGRETAPVGRVAAIGHTTVPIIGPIGTNGTIGGTIIGPPSTIIGTTTGTIIGMALMVGSVRTGGPETIGAGIMLPASTGGVGRPGRR